MSNEQQGTIIAVQTQGAAMTGTDCVDSILKDFTMYLLDILFLLTMLFSEKFVSSVSLTYEGQK
jgi:hypothetical protein